MSLVATSNAVFASVADTFRTRAKFVKFFAKGLRPNTKYSISVDGIEYGWAAKQIGKNLGDNLVSNDIGTLDFGLLVETPYNENYAFDTIITQLSKEERLNQQQIPNNYKTTTRLIELIAPNSYAAFQMPYRVLVVDDQPNRLEQGL